MSLVEALDLVTHTNWIEPARVTFKTLLNLTCNDLKPQDILMQVYSQKNPYLHSYLYM